MDNELTGSSDPKPFYSVVFPAELKAIQARREAREPEIRGIEDASVDIEFYGAKYPRCERGLTGLALSGGGIRSATFNLGILQGMAKIRNEKSGRSLLALFDYLSTVSGGGYIGSWWAGWMKQTPAAEVEDELRGKPRELICETVETPEPHPIRHLRAYSNYLTAKIGWLSSDTWSTMATYVRNAFLNLLIIVPLLAALLLVPRLTAKLTERFHSFSEAGALTAVALTAFGLMAFAIWLASFAAGRQEFPFTKRHFIIFVLGPLLLAVGLLHLLPFENDLWMGAGLWMLAFVSINLAAWLIYDPRGKSIGAKLRPSWSKFAWGAAALVAGTIGGLLFTGIFAGIGASYWSDQPWHLVTWGPPTAILLFIVAWNIQLGIRGKYESDLGREWWASMTGWLLAMATGWFLISALSIYGPLLFDLFQDGTKTQYAVITTWILSTMGAIFTGKSPKSGALQSTSWMDYAATVLAPVAVIGLLVAIAVGLNAILVSWPNDQPSAVSVCKTKTADLTKATLQVVKEGMEIQKSEGVPEPPPCDVVSVYWEKLAGQGLKHLLAVFTLSLLVGIGMGLAIDVNEFSMHAVYRNRLVRCYLRAGRRRGGSKANQFTDFDKEDDFALNELAWDPNDPNGQTPVKYQGPYLLINTALNIMDQKTLAWQERKATAFILAPIYCGSNVTGYRKTKEYADEITLGTALAISGAAWTSNMGYHSNRALSFFLSMFNVRLGSWVGNPRRDKYRSRGPRLGLLYLLTELFGWANAERKYVYLSDGGHFDNLGIYELVRRRCRYIVCCDAGEDGEYKLEDLGMAIRKIRADFGVDIEIDLDLVKPTSKDAYSRRHHAIGTIRYDLVDENSPVGTLVYIKASLVGTNSPEHSPEPADVQEYRARHPLFPHESTIDQFFSESQFEAYRKLGEHIGREVFQPAQQHL